MVSQSDPGPSLAGEEAGLFSDPPYPRKAGYSAHSVTAPRPG